MTLPFLVAILAYVPDHMEMENVHHPSVAGGAYRNGVFSVSAEDPGDSVARIVEQRKQHWHENQREEGGHHQASARSLVTCPQLCIHSQS